MATCGTYPSTKERVNYGRLCRAVVDLCTNVLRKVLTTSVVPSQLLYKVRCCSDLKHLAADELHRINHAVTHSTYEKFDISFLYKLIRAISTQELRYELDKNIPASNIWMKVRSDVSLMAQLTRKQSAIVQNATDYSDFDCRLLTQIINRLTNINIPHIIPSANEWGGKNPPKPTDMKLGDDVERIRIIRNSIYGHVSDTCVSDSEFQTCWIKLSGIIQRMDQEFKTGGQYLTDLNDIETVSLDDKWDIYESEINKLAQKEGEIIDRLEKQEASYKELQTNVASIKENIEKMGDKVDGFTSNLEKQEELKTEIQKQLTSLRTHIEDIAQDQESCVPLHIQKQNEKATELWTKEDEVFLETRATKQVLDFVDKHNIITVTGNAGTGKSATIHHVALKLKANGYDVLEVSSPSEIKTYLNPNGRQVFVLDDPVGVHSLDHQRLSSWIRQEKLSSCLSTGDIKLVSSIRKQIINEPEFAKEQNLLNRNIINLQDKTCTLDDQEKLQMLKKYLEVNKCDVRISKKLNTILKDTLHHFPLICKLFSSSKKFQNQGINFFKSPFCVVLEDLNGMKMLDKNKYCALVMCFVNRNNLDPKDFDPFNLTRNEITDSVMKACGVNENEFFGTLNDNIKSMSGVYLRREDGDVYHFTHELIHDVVAFHFGQKYPQQMIKFSPGRFISERVYVSKVLRDADPYVIKLESDHFQFLLDRLINDLDGDEYDLAVSSKCWDDEQFMNLFIKKLEENKGEILKLFCRKITQKLRYVDKLRSDIKHFKMHDFPKCWSWFIIATDLMQIPSITLIHCLVIFGQTRLFEAIWKILNTKERRDIVSDVPLLPYACFGGNLGICSKVLKEKDINNPCFHEHSIVGDRYNCEYFPLHLAAMKSTNITKFLLNKGANINISNQKGGFSGRTAITWASAVGNLNTVFLLINAGAEVNVLENPICFAAMDNHIETIQLLLDHNARVDMQNLNEGCTALIWASCFGFNEVLQLLLKHKASVNIQDNEGWTALMMASKYGHNEALQILLKHNASVDIQNNEGATALMWASCYGHSEAVQLLLAHKASVNMQDNEGRTGLMMASCNGYKNTVETLLNHKASIDILSKTGWTALMMASSNGHHETVQLLRSFKCNDCMQNNEGWTALMIASGYGHNEVVQLLGGDHTTCVNMQNKEGNTSLMMASCNGHDKEVQSLLNHKASVDIQNNEGLTALMMASLYGHTETVKILLNHAASVDKQNNLEWTGLMMASSSGHNDTIELLLSHRADVDIRNDHGWTALMFASRYGHDETTQLLINHNATVDVQDNEGWTALLAASQHGHSKIIQQLLYHEASVDIQSTKGWTALMHASRYGHNDAVDLLLNDKASVDMQNEQGCTALMWAASNGHSKVLQLLLDYNASVDRQSKGGWTALMMASANGHHDAVLCLLNANASVDIQNSNGFTAVKFASSKGHTDIVQLLLSASNNQSWMTWIRCAIL